VRSAALSVPLFSNQLLKQLSIPPVVEAVDKAAAEVGLQSTSGRASQRVFHQLTSSLPTSLPAVYRPAYQQFTDQFASRFPTSLLVGFQPVFQQVSNW
jgi:hypothetical protein